MEGKGPGAGDVVKLDVILAGRDGVALDTAVCRMIHLPVADVKYLAKAEAQGLGTTDLDSVSFAGRSIDSMSRPFKRANTSLTALPIPRFLAGWLGAALSKAAIRFDPEKCTLCGTCWKNCPGSAIEPPQEKTKGAVPVWKPDKCIVCYCCAELCPYEAIDFELSFFRNLFLSRGGALLAGAGMLFALIAAWLISMLF
jgi:NAD-dependent dihydropyrimidine dehydrogenase PreA subunit